MIHLLAVGSLDPSLDCGQHPWICAITGPILGANPPDAWLGYSAMPADSESELPSRLSGDE
jgi:hypothetical protein